MDPVPTESGGSPQKKVDHLAPLSPGSTSKFPLRPSTLSTPTTIRTTMKPYEQYAGNDSGFLSPRSAFSPQDVLTTHLDHESSFGVGPAQSSNPSTASTPVQVSGTSRKRARESLDAIDYAAGHKSHRATPSPAATRTPSSGSDTEDSAEFEALGGENSVFLRLLGENTRDSWRQMKKEQKEAEKAWAKAKKEKEEREKRDEEYARMLEEQYARELGGSSRPVSASSAASVPATFSPPRPLPSFQAKLTPSGGIGRPTPRSSQTQISSESTRGFQVTQIKPEPSNIAHRASVSTSAANNKRGDFVYLGSDSEDHAGTPSSSNSDDLQEIDGSAFRANNRHRKPNVVHQPTHPDFQNQRRPVYINKQSASASKGPVVPRQVPGPHARPPSMSSVPGAIPGAYTGSYLGPPMYSGQPVLNLHGSRNSNSAADAASKNWASIANQLYGRAMDLTGISPTARSAYSMIDQQMSNQPAPQGYSSFQPSGKLNMPGAFPTDPYGAFRQDLPGMNSGEHSLYTRDFADSMDFLNADPAKTAEELRTLLENIRPDEEISPEDRVGCPEAMAANIKLFEHQKLGLTWLTKMEEGSNKGSILADDMGLGKTIQALALIVSRPPPEPEEGQRRGPKTNLIVAPVALIRQWESEVKHKIKPEYRLNVHIYHGSGKNTTWAKLKTMDIVITTYGTVAAEFKRKETIDQAKLHNPNWQPSKKQDQLPLLGDECKFYRVVLDEAQNIKNKATKSAKAMYALESVYRLCMTGTPMMNNIGELHSLIHFLRIKPYSEFTKFQSDFVRPLMNGSERGKEIAMQKLQALLKAILLRRTKKSEIDGKPILDLPPRTTEISHAIFSEDEKALYKALETSTQLQFNKYLKAGTVNRNYSNVLVLLLRLRQLCDHPHLIKDFGIGGPTGEIPTDQLLKYAQEMPINVIQRIKDGGTDDCPICMDITENATIFFPCGHSTCAECFLRILEPRETEDGQRGTAKCPNCRAKVEANKVTDYNTFRKVHMSEPDDATKESAPDDESGLDTDSSEDDSDLDEDSDDSLDGFVVADDGIESDEETEEETYGKGRNPFERSKSRSKAVDEEKAQTKAERRKEKSKDKGKGKVSSGPKKPKESLAQLKKASMKNMKARRKYLRRLAKDYIPSAKIEKTMELLEQIQSDPAGEKTIIFSQFTSLLDLLEIPINRNNWDYRRYDGSMSATARNDAVIDFTTKPSCRIMLVSLKAGNAGLNLMAASQVIIFDPFWNPYIEEQAIDRAHRMGQRRPVNVHRILVPETVEDRIIALQEKKRALIEGALDEKASQSVGRLGVRELAFLFGVGPAPVPGT